MKATLTLLLAVALFAPSAELAAERGHSVSGVVYFTNNTPPKGSVLVELYTRDMKRLVASKRLDDGWSFDFDSVRPGRYVLRVSRENVCELRYKVDARKRERTSLKIIADVDCAHHNGELLPEPLS
ncbi:MAG TPA: hypothetical protein VFA21_21935 [Pyrinomonadaceae bacterium]|nr:hypothetical protein [Pyrinomonadaceae bacterium]